MRQICHLALWCLVSAVPCFCPWVPLSPPFCSTPRVSGYLSAGAAAPSAAPPARRGQREGQAQHLAHRLARQPGVIFLGTGRQPVPPLCQPPNHAVPCPSCPGAGCRSPTRGSRPAASTPGGGPRRQLPPSPRVPPPLPSPRLLPGPAAAPGPPPGSRARRQRREAPGTAPAAASRRSRQGEPGPGPASGPAQRPRLPGSRRGQRGGRGRAPALPRGDPRPRV